MVLAAVKGVGAAKEQIPMAVKTDVAIMSIQFLKDQPDQIKQKPPTDKRKGKDKLWKNKIQSKFGAA
jgi:hypothetical protein